jgi:uncharacterized protein
MNWTRLFVLIAVWPLFFLTRLNAQALPANAHTLLWKIDGKGLTQTSYILVNTTNTCETNIVLSEKVATALPKVGAIVFETAATNRAKEKPFLASAQCGPDDSYSAKKMLSPFIYLGLKEKAAEIGLSENFLSQYNLFFVKNRLEASCITCDLSRVVRLEDVLRDSAKKIGIPVTELLTIDEFFGIYHHYPQAFWDKSITWLLDHPERVTDALNSKAGAYRSEDLATLKTIIARDGYYGIRYNFQDQESARSGLLTTRIEKQIAATSALIVLDASEVANEPTSVFTALTTAGYTLTPVLQ